MKMTDFNAEMVDSDERGNGPPWFHQIPQNAMDPIRGFVFQFVHIPLKLLGMPPSAKVIVEAGEDLVAHDGNTWTLTQIKDRTSAISLTTRRTLEMLDRWANWGETQSDAVFQVISTQSPGRLADHSESFQQWVNGNHDEKTIAGIRASLLDFVTVRGYESVIPFLAPVLADAVRFTSLWNRIEWLLNQKGLGDSIKQLQDAIRANFPDEGLRLEEKLFSWVGAVALSATSHELSERTWTLDRLKRLTPDTTTILSRLEEIARGTSNKIDEIRGDTKAILLQVSHLTTRNRDALPASLPADWRQKLVACSQDLLNWPGTLPEGRWIDRPELVNLEEAISEKRNGIWLLLGDKGSGKTSLLSRIGRRAEEDGVAVMGLKADLLDRSVKDLKTLGESIGFGPEIVGALKLLATEQPVLLLIDQLDAVADLVCLHPGRINSLLNLIRGLDQVPNLRILCSCRTIEFHHDARLTMLKESNRVSLSLPSWEAVTPILREFGIDAQLWPESFRELLRTPLHLDLFLKRLRGQREALIFSSYQEMQDELWERTVVRAENSDQCRALLFDLADEMSELEDLWLAKLRFESRQPILDQMISAGWLKLSENRLKIGFSHQTLFSHVRARAFVQGGRSLADHVMARQDSLFVRPTFWTSLHFLRDAEPPAYVREVEKFLQHEPRRHLMYLLIEFLGQVVDPTDREDLWLSQLLHVVELRHRVLSAIKGNRRWFQRWAAKQFPTVMNLEPEAASSMVFVLTAAIEFAPEACLSLIQHHWLADIRKDQLTWRTMEEFTGWDTRTVDWVCQLVRRTDFQTWAISSICTRIAAHSPQLACKVVGAALMSRFERLEREPDPTPPDLGPNPPIEDQIVQQITFRPKERFGRELINDQGWYEITAVAEAAPSDFLEAVWPWFLRVVASSCSMGSSVLNEFQWDNLISCHLHLDGESHGHYLFEAIVASLKTRAKSEPTAFSEFVIRWGDIDSRLIQRLLCVGLIEIANIQPEIGLQFLISDPRRLTIGDHPDRSFESKRLIRAISSALSESDREALETHILQWTQYRPEADLIAEQLEWNREAQLKLIAAFEPNTLSESSQTKLRVAEIPPEEFAPRPRVGFREVVSPMSADEMDATSDDQIAALFIMPTDEVCGGQESVRMEGLRDHVSAAFREFAKRNPERAIRILNLLSSGVDESAVGQALEGLSESSCSDDACIKLICSLNQRGFESEQFRSKASSAIGRRAQKGQGLSDDICKVLEGWLGLPWDITVYDNSRSQRTNEQRHSLLWGYNRPFTLPRGSYSTLETLIHGYLLRIEPEDEQCLTILERHLLRSENPRVWEALCERLHWLGNCSPDRASQFLLDLFNKYPRVRDSVLAILLLPRVWNVFSDKQLQSVLTAIRDHAWECGPQAFGELLCLRSLWHPEDATSNSLLTEYIKGVRAADPKSVEILCGIAFAAARLWEVGDYRSHATWLLCELFESGIAEIQHCAMEVFLASHELNADEHTHEVLVTVARHHSALETNLAELMIEHMSGLLPHEAPVIHQLCKTILDLYGPQFSSIQHGFVRYSGHMTNIAMTLHNLGGESRVLGLEMFEKLLELQVAEAVNALNEIDSRPISIYRRELPRRTRRKVAK